MTVSYALQVNDDGTLRTLTLQDLIDVFTEALGDVDIKLGDIDLNTDTLEALGTTLAGLVDGLETLATSGNTKLDQLHTDLATTIAAFVDGLETLMTSVRDRLPSTGASSEATLIQVRDYLDTVETKLQSLITALGSPLLVETGPDTVHRGTTAGTVSLSAGEKLHSILVMPSSGGQVTVTIPGQAADQCPTDFPYSEDFGGRIVGAGNIVLAGDVDYYRITTA